jgi:hypothetical protein
MGMLEAGGESDLALEAVGTKGCGELGLDYLERDRAVVPPIEGEIDDRHAATPELALDGVAVGKRRTQLLRRVVDGGSGSRTWTAIGP